MCLYCLYLLQNEFEQLEAQVKDIESHREQLQKNLIDLVELKHVLLNAQVDFEHVSNFFCFNF